MLDVETFKLQANDAAKRGQLAGRKVLFGENKRFAVYPIHTRFGAVEWQVADAETVGAFGLPEIIRQADTLADAVKGLPHGEAR